MVLDQQNPRRSMAVPRRTYRETLDVAMLTVKSVEKSTRTVFCCADSLVRLKWPLINNP